MQNENTRRGYTQMTDTLSLRERMGKAQVRGKETHKGHPEFISGSTSFVTIQNKSEMLKQVQHDNRRGFTLIELLVVVLIIGVLAAVAVPQYQKAVYKAQVKEAETKLYNLKKALELYYVANGRYTTNLAELDMEYQDNVQNRCWVDLEVPEVIRCKPPAKYNILFQLFLDHGGNPQFVGRSRCFAYNDDKRAQDYCKASGMEFNN